MRYRLNSREPGPAVVLALGWMVMFISALNWLNYPPLIQPIIQDLSISFAEAGLLVTASSILGIGLQLPVGYLADRYNPKLIATVLLTVLFFPSFLAGFVTDYNQLFVTRILAGFGVPMFPVMSRIVANWYPRAKVGLAQGLAGGGFAGGIGAAALVMPILSAAFDWRTAFMISALPLIPITAAFWFIVKSSPARTSAAISSKTSFRFLHNPQTWLLTVLNISFFGTFITLVAWLPSFFFVNYGLSLTEAGIFSAVGLGLGIISRPLGGITADLFGKKKTVLTSVALLTSFYVLLSTNPEFFLAVILALLIGWFTMFGAGALFSLPPILFPREVGTVIGLASTIALILNALILPPVLGFIIDLTGAFTIGFAILAALAFIGIPSAARISEKRTNSDSA